MTSITGRVPVERISERARAAHPGRTALAVFIGLLFGAGWLIARLLGVLWIALAFAGSAVAEGWVAGRSADWARHVALRQEAQRAGRRR